MTHSQITITQGAILISGELTFATVNGLLEASQELFPQHEDWNCDLSGVRVCDSAGLALLLEWVKLAKRQGTQIRFLQLPQQLRTITMAAGLDKLLDQHAMS